MNLPYDPLETDFEYLAESEVPNQLHQAILEVVNGFDLISYTAFTINDETCIIELIELIDKAVGCQWML